MLAARALAARVTRVTPSSWLLLVLRRAASRRIRFVAVVATRCPPGTMTGAIDHGACPLRRIGVTLVAATRSIVTTTTRHVSIAAAAVAVAAPSGHTVPPAASSSGPGPAAVCAGVVAITTAAATTSRSPTSVTVVTAAACAQGHARPGVANSTRDATAAAT